MIPTREQLSSDGGPDDTMKSPNYRLRRELLVYPPSDQPGHSTSTAPGEDRPTTGGSGDGPTENHQNAAWAEGERCGPKSARPVVPEGESSYRAATISA